MVKYKIPKGENYHLEKEGETLFVQYTIKGKVYKKAVSLTPTTPEKLASCDEMLNIFNGSLVRIREDISII